MIYNIGIFLLKKTKRLPQKRFPNLVGPPVCSVKVQIDELKIICLTIYCNVSLPFLFLILVS